MSCRLIISPLTGEEVISQTWNEISKNSENADFIYDSLTSPEFFDFFGNWVKIPNIISTVKESSKDINPGIYKNALNNDTEEALFELAMQANSSDIEKNTATSASSPSIIEIAQYLFPNVKVGDKYVPLISKIITSDGEPLILYNQGSFYSENKNGKGVILNIRNPLVIKEVNPLSVEYRSELSDSPDYDILVALASNNILTKDQILSIKNKEVELQSLLKQDGLIIENKYIPFDKSQIFNPFEDSNIYLSSTAKDLLSPEQLQIFQRLQNSGLISKKSSPYERNGIKLYTIPKNEVYGGWEKDYNKKKFLDQFIRDNNIEFLRTVETQNAIVVEVGNFENLNQITDEYGNQWREITIDQNRDLKSIEFQKLTAEEKSKTIEQVTKEHRSIVALKDLAHKLAHRIGGKVKFENKTDADWKGYNQGNTSVLNEAYMTPDTPFHEILAHPIIRAIKESDFYKKVNNSYDFIEWVENNKPEYKPAPFMEGIMSEKRLKEAYDKYGKEFEKLYPNKSNTFNSLYQSLLKELETGRGKEVLDRIKKDYNKKKEFLDTKYDLSTKDGFHINGVDYGDYGLIEPEYFKQEGYNNKVTISKEEYLKAKKQHDDFINSDANKYTLEEQQEEAIVTLISILAAGKLNEKTDRNLISLLKQLLKKMSDFARHLLGKDVIYIDKDLDNISQLTDKELNKLLKDGEVTKKCN